MNAERLFCRRASCTKRRRSYPRTSKAPRYPHGAFVPRVVSLMLIPISSLSKSRDAFDLHSFISHLNWRGHTRIAHLCGAFPIPTPFKASALPKLLYDFSRSAATPRNPEPAPYAARYVSRGLDDSSAAALDVWFGETVRVSHPLLQTYASFSLSLLTHIAYLTWERQDERIRISAAPHLPSAPRRNGYGNASPVGAEHVRRASSTTRRACPLYRPRRRTQDGRTRYTRTGRRYRPRHPPRDGRTALDAARWVFRRRVKDRAL